MLRWWFGRPVFTTIASRLCESAVRVGGSGPRSDATPATSRHRPGTGAPSSTASPRPALPPPRAHRRSETPARRGFSESQGRRGGPRMLLARLPRASNVAEGECGLVGGEAGGEPATRRGHRPAIDGSRVDARRRVGARGPGSSGAGDRTAGQGWGGQQIALRVDLRCPARVRKPTTWRREWDSNPRGPEAPRLFKSRAFVRSAIPPGPKRVPPSTACADRCRSRPGQPPRTGWHRVEAPARPDAQAPARPGAVPNGR